MYKFNILKRILRDRIVAIIRSDSAEGALKMSEACIDGGVTSLEISFTTPDTLEVIKTLRQRYGEGALIGAGTVLDPETARLAILAGSKFILSPSLDREVIRMCSRYQVVSMPGVQTATEVVEAMEWGADIIKVFPGESFGPAYLKALLAPLPHAPLMPSGGVSLENAKDWFDQGVIAIGVGSSLTGPGNSGNYAEVTNRAKQFVHLIKTIPSQVN